MLLKYFYDKSLAHASYLVGCQKSGEAIVIDPSRDVTHYLEAAKAEGLRIVGAAETHIHADFVSGSRELADRVGAKLYLSDEGPKRLEVFCSPAATIRPLLKDGDAFYDRQSEIRSPPHAGPHAGEHFVRADRRRRRSECADGHFHRRFCVRGLGRQARPARNRGRRRRQRRSRRTATLPFDAPLPRIARPLAGVAGPRCGERLRQGPGRHPVEHGGL